MLKNSLFYIITLAVIVGLLWFFVQKLSMNHNEFFGFAENKQTEINLDKDIVVKRILVRKGEKVKQGQLIMQVVNKEVEQEISQLNLSIEGVKIKSDLTQAEIQGEVLDLVRQKELKLSELSTKIAASESEINFYQELLGNKATADEVRNHPASNHIQQLKSEAKRIEEQYDMLISHYKKLLNQPKETFMQKNLLENKRNNLNQQMAMFDVVAPYDGVIGNLNVRQDEFVKAFTSMMSFYESTPPFVTGYIQEKYDVKLEIGDSVAIKSLYRPVGLIKGVISAKGYRVVEIPEKFRKIPDVKIYGVEVFISIPRANAFLQNEVLKISPIQ